MAGNSFGQAFRITTAGESHGPGNIVIIDGVPPGIPLSVEDLLVDLNRRRPGQSKIVTQRQEADRVEILSGVFEAQTLGTSIAMLVRNTDARLAPGDFARGDIVTHTLTVDDGELSAWSSLSLTIGNTAPEAPEARLEWARALKRSGDPRCARGQLEHLILTYPTSALVPQKTKNC